MPNHVQNLIEFSITEDIPEGLKDMTVSVKNASVMAVKSGVLSLLLGEEDLVRDMLNST